MSSCFFIGHRNAPSSLLPRLCATVEALAQEQGVRLFTVGHYGNFDRLAAAAVRKVKQRRPELLLELLLPYHPALRPVPDAAAFDRLFYPPDMEAVPPRLAIARANRYMAAHCDHLVVYLTNPASNTRDLLDFARQRAASGSLQIHLL